MPCEECTYYQEIAEGWGKCIAHPPTANPHGSTPFSPRMKSTEAVCGEYRPGPPVDEEST